MGEPLSIASGVAGIVTLGLTVCSGLDTYFRAIKDRKDDIKEASQLLALLRSHVGLIESNASTLNNRYARATEAVIKVLDLCQGQLQDLDEVIKKVSSVGGCSDMARALRKSKSTISYPFNRKMLVQVQDQLLKTTGVLGTCVQTLILNIDVGVSQDLEAFRNAVNDSALVTNGFLSRLDSGVETMGSAIGQTTAELTRLSEKVEEQKTMTSSTHALIRDTSDMVANIKSGMEEIQSWHRVQLKAIEAAGRDNTPRYLENTVAEREVVQDSFTMKCTCKESETMPVRKALCTYKFWGGLTIRRLVESREDHKPTCSYYTKFSSRTLTKTKLTYSGLRGILSWALDVSVQRDQVSGLSVFYRPRTYNVVQTNQAFETMGYGKCFDKTNTMSVAIELQRELEGIYAARGASPFDVDEDGWNAAHWCIWGFGLRINDTSSPKYAQELLNGLKMVLLFLSRVGVNIHAGVFGDNSMLESVVMIGLPSLLPCVYDALEECDPQFDPDFDQKAMPKIREYWPHLKNRRQRLRQIALRNLSGSELQELRVTGEELPDKMAEEIWARLCQKGVLEDRHDGLRPDIGYESISYGKVPFDRRGIFHFLSSPQVADMAFNLGFRSIDVPDINHATPILNLATQCLPDARVQPPERSLAYAEWLLEKGARTDCSTNSLAISAAHKLAMLAAKWAVAEYKAGLKDTDVLTGMARVVSVVCHSNAQSHLPCPCSPGDLSRPLHYFFVTALDEFGYRMSYHARPSNSHRKHIRQAIHLVGLLSHVAEGLDLAYMARSIVHVLTMKVLALRHLDNCHQAWLACERVVQWMKDNEEWEYTLREDRELIDKLEDLTEEFEQEFLKQNVSIGDFLWNHWLPTMRQYWEEIESLDEERKQELRRLGVVLEEGYETSCGSSDSDLDKDEEVEKDDG
ncbi:hypothetical protein FDECE_12496 [Fusarium decemcellulare]|nr:hypothetical protein FDECE_12496 [Fusarium decemcellulare]